MGGDPHFTTLDDFTYTFNGLGEYVLLRAAGEINVEFQARTALVPSSNATVFSAFTIQHEDIIIQVHCILVESFLVEFLYKIPTLLWMLDFSS